MKPRLKIPHPKTIALVAVAAGMLTGAYLLAPVPAPAAQAAPAALPVARQAPVAASSRLTSYVKTFQAPVPLVVGKHDQYFDASPAPEAASNQTQPKTAPDVQQAEAPSDTAAKTSIELDGYRNVRGLVKLPDGMWHGRAMRGRVEIAVSVDANGSVAQD